MTKWKKFKKWLFDIADDFLAYVLTIVGILFSSYLLPSLRAGGEIVFNISWWKIAASMIAAFLIVLKQESIEPDEEGNTDKSRAGRKRKFSRRMFNALAQGMMWSQLFDALPNLLG